ncbi:ATP-binding protein [Pleionea sp. CnH1-48]|uniref:ATP-binding protein n=1 Tax=Pleionea sp. CnH1-48 TaxID=2954494 RepID=UPI002097BFFA|nr:ATP-binding protein [Pleionea sp. CnH1-48]MCO7225704.1 ATP-binding protein [Pleionea sp. CnH1-48]
MWPFNKISIFWKLFLWFWGSILFLFFVSLFIWVQFKESITFHDVDPGTQRVLSKMKRVLESDVKTRRKQRLLHALHGPVDVFRMRTEEKLAEKRRFIPHYILDEEGIERAGHPVPESLSALHLKRKQQGMLSVLHGDLLISGPKRIVIDDERYYLYLSRHLGRFRTKVFFRYLSTIKPLQFSAAILVSCLLSFLMALSIVGPIRRLQQVARQMANGESVSAVDKMGRRRDEFYELACDFDSMYDTISKVMASQKQLVSDVSHELRSPLARLQVAAGLIEQKAGEELKEDVERIEMECHRLNDMISQLLHISALERGQVYEAEQLFELNSLLDDVIQDVAFEAKAREISLRAQLESQIQFSGYFTLLRSAIENILRNALRYSPDGGSIMLTSSLHKETLQITIEDEGPGVAEAELQNIFKPFYRVDSARARRDGDSGAGLGLAIASRAIDAHQGSLSASNRSTGGLCVTIEVPIKKH